MPHLRILVVVITTFVLLLPGHSYADISLADKQVSLKDHVYSLKTADTLSIEAVSNLPLSSFTPPLGRDYSDGYDRSHYWFRFSIDFTQTEIRDWLLEIPFPLLDEVVFYEPSLDGGFEKSHTGDRFPFSERAMPVKNFLFPIKNTQGEQTYYLHVKTQDSVQVPLVVWPDQAYMPEHATSVGLQMAFFGAMLVMIIYNIFIYVSTRDKNYLFYVAFISLMVLFQLGLQGLSHQWFWPNLPWWSNVSIPLFGVMSLGCGLLFVRHLLRTRWTLPKFDLVLRFISYCMLVTGPVIVFGDYDFAIDLSLIVTSIFFNLTLVALILLVLKGDRTAKIVLGAWSIFLVAGSISTLGVQGLLPLEYAGTHVLQIGSMFEVVLLSLALADRIKTLRKEKMDMETMSSDILRLSNEQLEKSNRMKDAFIATISHEVKTPMNAILGSSQLLKNKQLNDEQSQYVDVIERSGNSLLTILDNILEYSKLEAGKVAVIDRETNIVNLCEEVTALFEVQLRTKPVRLWLSYEEGLPETVYTDNILLSHLLMNLLSNAVKFTENGFVWAHISMPKSGRLEIQVTDSGIGMNQTQLQRIFHAFTQGDDTTSRHYGGTGLGLVISKKICELLDGAISVNSNEGEGTVFTAEVSASPVSGSIDDNELPLCVNLDHEIESKLATERFTFNNTSEYHLSINDHGQATITHKDNHALIKGAVTKNAVLSAFNTLTGSEDNTEKTQTNGSYNIKRNVLAVDDDPVNRMVISKILDRLDVDYEIAASGNEALSYIKQKEFDVVLMDIEMPDKDGYDTTQEIRSWEQQQNSEPLNIVALSAHASTEFKDKALLSGMNGFLSKPVKIPELKVLIFSNDAIET